MYKYTRNGQTSKHGEKQFGPYWYAYWYNGTKMVTYYIGKTLPPELEKYTQHINRSPEPNKKFTIHPLLKKLEVGEQVIVSMQEIADAFGGYYSRLDQDRYLIYK